jgi:hypothetical protein
MCTRVRVRTAVYVPVRACVPVCMVYTVLCVACVVSGRVGVCQSVCVSGHVRACTRA